MGWRRAAVVGAIAMLPAASTGALGASARPTGSAKPKTLGPTSAAWFDEARPTKATPAAPEAGVGPTDLLVGGVTLASGLLPVSLPVKLPTVQKVTAFVALSFRVPKGATPATLTLDLTGTSTAKLDHALPSGVSPLACITTSRFAAGTQQPLNAAPSYNCRTRSVVGELGAGSKTVQFPGIGRLLRGRQLSFVVLPGSLGLERLVFSKPGVNTLSLLRFPATPIPKPLPTPSPIHVRSSPAPHRSRATSAAGAGSTNLPPPPATGTGTVPSSNPGLAPVVAGTATPQPVSRVAAVSPVGDTRTRLAALALLVGLAVLTGWLAITDDVGRAMTTLRIVRAVSAGAPLPAVADKEWGVGRFRSTRVGSPPSI